MRLSHDSAPHLPASIAQPGYDRDAQAVGIVHIGIGAFHRAHQAVYTDDSMHAGDRNWAITGVSLRSDDVAQQLNPQDGLYTVTARTAESSTTRLIGAVRQVLVAPKNPDAVIAALSAPTTHIVSLTITEKGYCRAADGTLDVALAGPGSVYAYLAAAFERRRAAGIGGLTLLCCDNLAHNGAQLEKLMQQYLAEAHQTPDLRRWFEQECACPSTMVDRIVPATTDADRADLQSLLTLRDDGAVITEGFSQWVIEDRFAGPRPRWDLCGAQLTRDVRPFETAKLRMLNGAHSALAYLGLARGHSYVHEAMADPMLGDVVARIMRAEAAPSLAAAPGLDLASYADALMLRFANPSLHHRLAQIAMDGTQKIPQRWLETLAFHQSRGAQCPALLSALGAWMRYARGDFGTVDDPLADRLHAIWQAAGIAGAAAAFFGPQGLFSAYWVASDAEIKTLSDSLI